MENKIIYEQSVSKRGIVTFSCKGKLLYSAYNPQKEAANYLATIPEATQKQNVITFCGANFINKELEKKTEIENILSFEPVDFPITTESTKIHHIKTLKDLENTISKLQIDSKNIAVITWPAFIETQKDVFIEYLGKIKDILIKQTLSTVTDNTFSKLENLHVEKNKSRFSTFRILLNQVISENMPPAVVFAAGASLAAQVEFIKPYLNKVMTFAYPSSLPYLQQVNISPDYTIAVDPGYATFYHLMKYNRLIDLLCPLSLNGSIFSLKNYAPLIFNYGSEAESKIFRNTNIIKSLPEGSVAFNLFSILKKVGYKQIILLGQDFCFIDGASHVKGGFFETEYIYQSNYIATMEDKIKKLEQSRLPTYIKDNDKKLKTDTAMAVYYNHFLEKSKDLPLFLAGTPYNTFCNKIPFLEKTFFETLPTINKENYKFASSLFSSETKI